MFSNHYNNYADDGDAKICANNINIELSPSISIGMDALLSSYPLLLGTVLSGGYCCHYSSCL